MCIISRITKHVTDSRDIFSMLKEKRVIFVMNNRKLVYSYLPTCIVAKYKTFTCIVYFIKGSYRLDFRIAAAYLYA